MGVKKLFLNKGTEDSQVVKAPAFSLTKVMAVVAPVVTALSTAALSWLKSVDFKGPQITVMVVALVAFLAITASADVLARGLATAATTYSAALEKVAGARTRLTVFSTPLTATLVLKGLDEAIQVIAVSDEDPPAFLCRRADETIEWRPSKKVTFG